MADDKKDYLFDGGRKQSLPGEQTGIEGHLPILFFTVLRSVSSV